MSRGVWVFVLMLTIVGFMVFFAALNLQRPIASPEASRVLVFDVPSVVEESERRYSFLAAERTTLHELTAALRRAADDKAIASLVVHVGNVGWGWGKMREMRDAVAAFGASGKPVYATLGWSGDSEYYLASAADVIAVPPATLLQIDGLAASVMFYRGAFDKLGVAPHYARVGAYKSAPESYTRRSMSAPMQEALDAMLDDQFDELIGATAEGRAIDSEEVRQLLDEGPYTSETALVAGLIDTVMYRNELEAMVLDADGANRTPVTLESYAARRSGGGARLAMIVAEGTIAQGKSAELPWQDQVAGSETLIEALEQAAEQRSIKAILLRINSPGGSLPAADEIWRAVQRAADEKPVIVSMSNLAASGGYYIAAPADWIVAQPTTLTGSIGIYAGKFNVRGLYEKLGLDIQTLWRGRHARMLSQFEEFTPEEAARFQSQVDDGYRLFLTRVTEGRDMDRDAVDEVGQGRVWTGKRALEIGLVDELGGLDAAIAAALSQLDLPRDSKYSIEHFPKIKRTFLQNFVNDMLYDESMSLISWPKLPPVAMSWLTAAQFPTGTSLALQPFSVEFR